VRIIGGKYKGHRLVSFNASHIRPTTDRVKESIFNILMSEVPGAHVLDLFSGTGNLGIESLSREAEDVCFVEKNKKSLKILKENLNKLKIKSNFEIYSEDVFSFLKKYSGKGFEVILIDPPFTEALGHSVMEALAGSKVLKEGSVVAIETAKKEKIEESYQQLSLHKRKEFGDKILSIFV